MPVVLRLAALVALLAFAPGAQAATIGADADGATVFTGGEGITVLEAGRDPDGRVWLASRFGDPITETPASCTLDPGDAYTARCTVGPAGLRVALGPDDDAATVRTDLGVPLTVDAGPGADRVDVRDGVRNSVDCGLDTDRLLIDAVDIHTGCEDIQRGEGAQIPDGPPPEPSLSFERRRLRTALLRGLVVTLSSGPPNTVVPVTLRFGTTVVARGRIPVRGIAIGSTTVRFTAAARRRFRARTTLTLRAVARDTRATVRLRR